MLIKINRSIQPVALQLPMEVLAINKRIQLVVRNWLLVNILRANNREYEHLVNRELQYRSLDLRIVFLQFLLSALPITFGTLLVLGIIYANIEYFLVEPSTFLLFLYMFLRFVQSISSANQLLGRVIANLPQFKIAVADFFKLSVEEIEASVVPTKLISFFNLNPSFQYKQKDSTQNMKIISSPPQIEFQNITFSYEPCLEPVLNGINLEIEDGQQIGIIGRSGSGT